MAKSSAAPMGWAINAWVHFNVSISPVSGFNRLNPPTDMRLILCFIILTTLAAQAQFDVSLKLPRSNFMALEAIKATVVITNRTGATAVLGGPGRANWLSFEMVTTENTPLAAMDVSGADLVQIPPGGTIQRKVTVTDAYSPTDVGNYAIIARVLHVPSGDFYASQRTRFTIVDAKAMWERSYGVPPGFKGAGQTRKYSLSMFRDIDETSLYFRMIDDKSSERIMTYRLGPISLVYDPQIAIDAQNQLQVLFMAQQDVFAYAIVAPDGKLKKMAYYRQKGSDRPMMQQGSKGNIMITGGEYFDPSAPPPARPKVGGRNIDEKPPGL